MFIYCLVALISGLICGAISYKINTEKGYDGGFAWGFFLGVIGIVVVACRADNSRYYNGYSNSEYDSRLSSMAVETQRNKLLNDGGWVCSNCHNTNPKYVTTCTCGMYIKDNDKNNTRTEKNNAENVMNELKTYKEMVDSGLITQEEFDSKKKQLLEL